MIGACMSTIDAIIGNVGQDTLANIEDQIVSSVKNFLFVIQPAFSHQALALSILSHVFTSNLPNVDVLIMSLLFTTSTDSQIRLESINFLINAAKV